MVQIQIAAADLLPLDQFPLRWRWTDERHNVLPAAALATIRPVTPAKAREVWDLTFPYPVRFGEERIETSTEGDVAAVRRWLQDLGLDQDSPVVVTWKAELAVTTTWGVFCAYWDDFCYPSSDDVAVVSTSGEWLLCYDHEERFTFGDVRSGA